MADRTPVDVILPCLTEAEVSPPVLLGEDRTGWWAIAADDTIAAEDDVRPAAAEPGVPDSDADRASHGRDPAVRGARAGAR